MPKAARFAASNSFRNAGQVCVSTERIYVHEAIADRFIESLIQCAEAFTPGDGTVAGVRMGPMINHRQRDHVLRHIEQAVQSGAQLLSGGQASETGAFLTPTVLDGVDHSMLIAQEETFGPVAAVIRVPDEGEAIRLANDSPFGLGAIVFSQDLKRAENVARQLKAGMVGINRGVGGAQGTPWVGARQSGYGYHKSTFGHRQFTQVRVLSREFNHVCGEAKATTHETRAGHPSHGLPHWKHCSDLAHCLCNSSREWDSPSSILALYASARNGSWNCRTPLWL